MSDKNDERDDDNEPTADDMREQLFDLVTQGAPLLIKLLGSGDAERERIEAAHERRMESEDVEHNRARHEGDARRFWESCFVRLVVGERANVAARGADDSLKEWCERFGSKSGGFTATGDFLDDLDKPRSNVS